jgi:hypothetical protein
MLTLLLSLLLMGGWSIAIPIAERLGQHRRRWRR